MDENWLWRITQHGKDFFDLLRRDGFLRRDADIVKRRAMSARGRYFILIPAIRRVRAA